jgi:hypothetical protein
VGQAFLRRMDHFDRILELELARLLDPIVNAPVPRRRRRRGGLTVVSSDLSVLVEPVPVPIVVVAPIVTPVS